MLDRNQPVRIYWNYKHRCYSIFQRGAVRASARQVHLEGVVFTVRESGRQKMLREGRKIIHAYASGRLADFVRPGDSRTLTPFHGTAVHYDPYRHGQFVVDADRTPVIRADAARFDEAGTRVLLAHELAA